MAGVAMATPLSYSSSSYSQSSFSLQSSDLRLVQYTVSAAGDVSYSKPNSGLHNKIRCSKPKKFLSCHSETRLIAILYHTSVRALASILFLAHAKITLYCMFKMAATVVTDTPLVKPHQLRNFKFPQRSFGKKRS